ncbi:phosphotransferase [Paenibacillus luteus]|uniref:phosphotransferase n=1 Tax=Paenibacillus luteus TaxID=2545753 RepID=UPI00114251CC|nr:phosphotransferase [Paenibacillus luteus]
MIPTKFEKYRELFPILDQSTNWLLLRKWSLSEVYRFKPTNGTTMIIKWSSGDMARESSIYNELLSPLLVRSPRIYGYFNDGNAGIMLMEDVGKSNLEQEPDSAYFIEAVRELARFRLTAAASIQRGVLSTEVLRQYTVNSTEYLEQLQDLIRYPGIKNNNTLQTAVTWLPEQLKRLDQEIPLTLIHNDYASKNLVAQNDRVMPIDWSNTYLGRHSGDLYCLVKETEEKTSVFKEAVLLAYAAQFHPNPTIEMIQWQLRLGGICWLIHTLSWLIKGGIDTIPGSEAWVPGLVEELEELLDT